MNPCAFELSVIGNIYHLHKHTGNVPAICYDYGVSYQDEPDDNPPIVMWIALVARPKNAYGPVYLHRSSFQQLTSHESNVRRQSIKQLPFERFDATNYTHTFAQEVAKMYSDYIRNRFHLISVLPDMTIDSAEFEGRV